MRGELSIQLVEGAANLIQHFMAARRQPIDAWSLRSLRLGCTKPPPLGHPREHWIQRAGAQPIPVVVQFFQHPLPVDSAFVGVVQDVDLPEREEELTNDRIAHGEA